MPLLNEINLIEILLVNLEYFSRIVENNIHSVEGLGCFKNYSNTKEHNLAQSKT